ncbi:MAG TPA: glycosyltransferase family 39 protein [Caulobacteraceae bacterium]|nr:glycosyltransferase family 39 protein [Caulobacteraceae bacterium]
MRNPAPAVLTLLVILIGVALRLIASHFVGLGVDESYSVAAARDLQLSYFDHPPAQYWLVHAIAPLVGYGRGSRWPFIALFAGSSWMMFVLTRRLFGALAGLWAVLALNLSAFFTLPAASWVLPDGPLILGLLGAAASLARIWFPQGGERERPWRDWLLAGAWIGVAALSKYQAALFGLGVGLAVLTMPGRRTWLFRPQPWVGAILAVLVFSPVLVWNAHHHWASFAFQTGRGAPTHGVHVLGPIEALLAQAALLLPWVFVPLAMAAWSAARSGPSENRRWFLVMLAAPTLALFTLTPLFGGLGLPHWPMPGWLLLFPLLGERLATAAMTKRWPGTWLAASVALLVALGAGAAFDADTGALGAALPKLFKRGDPTAESIEWTAVRTELLRRGDMRPPPPPPLLVATQWNDAGKLAMVLGDRSMILVFSPDPHEFGLRAVGGGLVGRDALILGRVEALKRRLPALAGYFESVSWEAPIAVGREGRAEIVIGVIRAHRLLRPYPLPAYARQGP